MVSSQALQMHTHYVTFNDLIQRTGYSSITNLKVITWRQLAMMRYGNRIALYSDNGGYFLDNVPHEGVVKRGFHVDGSDHVSLSDQVLTFNVNIEGQTYPHVIAINQLIEPNDMIDPDA